MLLLSTPNNYNHNNLLNVIVMQLTSLHLYIRHIIFDPFSIHYDPSFHSVSLWYYNRYYRIFKEIYDEQTITVGLFWTQHVQMKLSIVILLDYLISAFLYLIKKENNNNNIILYLDYIISTNLISLKITGDIHTL